MIIDEIIVFYLKKYVKINSKEKDFYWKFCVLMIYRDEFGWWGAWYWLCFV